MVATIVISVLIGALFIWNIWKMVRNVKKGKSICGCGCSGNCSECSGCK